MKKYAIVLFLALGSVAAQAQDKWNAEPYLTRSLTKAAIKNVFVTTSGGSISVNGTNAAEARIEVYVRPNNDRGYISKEELKQRLDENYTLEITDSNNELHAKAKSKQNNMDWRNSVSISFKIYVPKMVATNLTTSGGSIKLADITGDQNFTTSGGSLHVTNLSGKIKGRTSGGSIHVDGSKEDIDLVTSGGSITASSCEGRINLVTSGGSLKLSQLKGNINATTSGGSVNGNNISGELSTSTSGGSISLTQLACSVEGSTSAGSITAQFNALGKYVKLNTSAGSINLKMPSQKGLDLDLRGNRVSAKLNGGFQGTNEKDRIEGKLNGGGVPVSANASSGRVSLVLE
jgi:DUF4097 and DUF4098 domain-containing protein YvlB